MTKATSMNRILITSVIIFFSLHLMAGGPWPQKKGKGYYKLYEWWIVANQHYTDVGLIDPNVTTGIFNTTFYGEYGLTERITLIANAPLFSRATVNNQISATTGETIIPGDAINGVGDIDLSIKYGLTKPGSRVALAGTLLFGLPTGISEGGLNSNLQTGDGEFNQLLSIDAGLSLYHSTSFSAYASFSVGYNNRTNKFSDEARYGAEVGLGLFNQKLWFFTRWNGITSMKNGITSSNINSTSIFANNSEFQSISFGTAAYINENLGFSAEVATAVAGRIILAKPSYSFGVFLDLK
jgi:hypothetical protein